MKTKYILTGLAAVLLLTNCNKEKRMMKGLEGNWRIESSTKSIFKQDGTEEVFESISNPGKLVVSAGPSKEIKQYDFFYVSSTLDTMKAANTLVTDEFNRRLIMTGGFTDTNGVVRNLVWTIEKEKKNVQVWSTYGIDSTFFYPANTHNPGGTNQWLVWRIVLKRD